MKKLKVLLSLLLIAVLSLSSCSLPIPGGGNNPSGKLDTAPFPEDSFVMNMRKGVIGAIVQTGDGNAYVSGSVPTPAVMLLSSKSGSVSQNKHLVTLEHSFGSSCYVSGYMGNSLYIIQGFGSLAWNKKGIGHKDGTILLEYGENGYFSISAVNENKIIVGNPSDSAVESLWDDTESYRFGYMVYDEESKQIVPLYEENNLRFYTAGYFINGIAQVSVKENGRILFGAIDTDGNYVVEPKYEMMADESINGLVIVATSATNESGADFITDTCGRSIYYSSTLMTNVQFSRQYSCKSQTVGLINVHTGNAILPCNNAYVERVMNDTYFVIDADGNSFLFDARTKEQTPVDDGVYSYFNNEWMLYIDSQCNAYLADKELKLYDASELSLNSEPTYRYKNTINCINTNILSANRDEIAKNAYSSFDIHAGLNGEYDPEKSTYTLTVDMTGEVIEDVDSFTYIYNGGFLFAKENSLYRYDINTQSISRIETGFGNFTDDYKNRGTRYYTSIYELDLGLFVLRYNIQTGDGQSYLMLIVNDRGDVLFDTAINSVETLDKNYLGRYDDALYSLAGSTNIEDNYFLTRDDGAHFLIQFVRGESSGGEFEDGENGDYTRIIGDYSDFVLLSPFMLNLKDGSSISVAIGDKIIPSDAYVYDSEEQTLKILMKVFDYDNNMIMDKLTSDRYFEFTVIAADETVTLRIEVSPFSIRL